MMVVMLLISMALVMVFTLIYNAIADSKYTETSYSDFLTQMQQIKKMGPLSGVLKMLPGMSNIGDIDIPDDAMKKPEAIIRSMTPKERRHPEVLNASRRRRIAKGSGVSEIEVNRFIKNFKEMKEMMSGKGKMGGMMKNLMRSAGGAKGGDMPDMSALMKGQGGMPDMSQMPDLSALMGGGGKPKMPKGIGAFSGLFRRR